MKEPPLERVDVRPIGKWECGSEKTTAVLKLAFSDYFKLFGEIFSKKSNYTIYQPQGQLPKEKKVLSDDHYIFEIEYSQYSKATERANGKVGHEFKILIRKNGSNENMRLNFINYNGLDTPGNNWELET